MWAADAKPVAPAAEPPLRHRFALLGRGSADGDTAAVEQALLRLADEGIAAAHVWEPPCGLVVPASYRRFERFAAAVERFGSEGVPVRVRCSGGGLVPQGPGVVNFSLAWRTRESMGQVAVPVYGALCGLLQSCLTTFGVVATAQPVSDSFCDGRYNLACGGRKIAGTAQYWRRANDREQLVLAHACLLVDADLAMLTARANAFESEIGSGRVYRAEAITNLAHEAGGPKPNGGTRRRVTPSHVVRLLQQIASDSTTLC
jgi:lipoate-protein ligase A